MPLGVSPSSYVYVLLYTAHGTLSDAAVYTGCWNCFLINAVPVVKLDVILRRRVQVGKLFLVLAYLAYAGCGDVESLLGRRTCRCGPPSRDDGQAFNEKTYLGA